MSIRRLGVVLAALTAFAIAGPARAETCPLMQVASLDMTTEQDGEIAVPAEVNGHSGLMLIDTGGIQSAIGDAVANRLELSVRPARNSYMLYGGVVIDKEAYIDRFTIGPMTAHGMTLLIEPNNALHSDTIGILSPDIMSNYDVEFDFAGGKFNLYEPERCDGQVVYWTKQPYAVVPLTLDSSGHMLITIALDGKQLTAAIDTGADRSTMSLAVFKRIFGKSENDPAMSRVGSISINGTKATTIYRYGFKTLTFEGVNVGTPNIDIPASSRFTAGEPDIILGVETLRQLHMYVAYKEKRLYVTGAEAR